MITQVLHLEQLGSDPWVLPIYGKALQTQTSHGRGPLPPAVLQLGQSISMRLTLLPSLGFRVNGEISTLLSDIKNIQRPQHVYTARTSGVTLRVSDKLKYLLIADLHGFLHELDACADAMRSFLHAIHDYVGQPLTDAARKALIDGWMQVRGGNPKWVQRLASARNFVAHDRPIYPAVDISATPWDLLLLKDFIVIPAPAQCFRISELATIVDSFNICKAEMQAHLLNLLA